MRIVITIDAGESTSAAVTADAAPTAVADAPEVLAAQAAAAGAIDVGPAQKTSEQGPAAQIGAEVAAVAGYQSGSSAVLSGGAAAVGESGPTPVLVDEPEGAA